MYAASSLHSLLSSFPLTCYCYASFSATKRFTSYAPWPMFQHDSFHTGLSPYKGPQTNRTKWITQVCNEIGRGITPVIGPDGTIYVSCVDRNLVAVNPSNGNVKWRYVVTRDDPAFATGSSPAVGRDGTIYLPVDEIVHRKGYLYAFYPDGIRFRVELEERPINSHITIGPYGNIYVGSIRRGELGIVSKAHLYLFYRMEG